MGKTIKKQKQGNRPPRTHVASALPDCTHAMVAHDPLVTCPHCLQASKASEFAYESGVEGHRCPICHSPITQGDFFTRYRELMDNANKPNPHAQRFFRRLNKLKRMQNKTTLRFLALPLGLIVDLYTKLHGRYVRERAQRRDQITKANALPASAYYLSDWFSLTARPLQHKPEGKGLAWDLTADFDGEGRLHLARKNKSAGSRGAYAEWTVFNQLSRAAREVAELSGMKLCPNIFLPNASSDENDRLMLNSSFAPYRRNALAGIKPLYSQIDCLALTQHAVYVIEVKGRRGTIEIAKNGMPFRRESDSISFDLTKDVRQCERHASAFATRYASIPYDRIYELTIYVDSELLGNKEGRFRDNILVSNCSAGQAAFIDAIQEEERKLADGKPLFSPDQLETLTEAINRSFGDRTGKKEQLHLERIELLQEADRQHRATRKARRAS